MQRDVKVMATVLATANYLEKIPVELLDRFLLLYVESYDSEDFVKVAKGPHGEGEARKGAG